MTEYRVNLWGWIPENEYRYGGSPEYADVMFVSARSAREAMGAAEAQFRAQHPDVIYVETVEGG